MINSFLLSLCIFYASSQPAPLNVDLINKNTSNLDFALNLPNNETVQIGLSFRLLSYTNISADTPLKDHNGVETSTTSSTALPEKKFVTVAEAIEGFRQDLMKKEMEIAGIIQSKDVFYRHFKLEFDDETILSIRCTYDSDYSIRLLKISCNEYREFETERILSTGEVEIIKQSDPDYKSDVELVNLRGMRQTYQMVIS